MREKAAALVAQLSPLVEHVTVIYSNPEETKEDGPGTWIQVPNEYYFGRKFREALAHHKSDIFVNLQADAACSDWTSLIAKCRTAFDRYPLLGMWTTEVDWSWWTTPRVSLGQWTPDEHLIGQTDGIFFALRAEIVDRLIKLDYNRNNLGWGVEWPAICYAYSHNMFVLRDTSVKIDHPKGSGYDHTEARKQQDAFLAQMTVQEKIHFALLYRYVARPGVV